jgi:carbon-monoxide dehydrogenase small subunit
MKCGIGLCGSCTVVVGKEAARSCRTSLADVQGKDVTTIEGLAQGGRLHPLQQAFIDKGGFQCGYCTPGMIMNAYGLRNPHPSREGARDGGQSLPVRRPQEILEAIESVAKEEGWAYPLDRRCS